MSRVPLSTLIMLTLSSFAACSLERPTQCHINALQSLRLASYYGQFSSQLDAIIINQRLTPELLHLECNF